MWYWWLISGLFFGFAIGTFVWCRIFSQEIVGDLRLEQYDDLDKPILYLAMNDSGWKKLKKGTCVSFYVRDEIDVSGGDK